MDLKKTLKIIKLHEQEISMALGVIILIVAGIFIIRYVKNLKNQSQIAGGSTTQNQPQAANQTHTVSKGETLWSISENYYKQGADWKKIADANSISTPTKLVVGQNLIIPGIMVFNTTQAQTKTPSQSPTPKPQITETAASTNSTITGANYTVVKGDNLWTIAVRAYGDGYKWPQIAEANHLHNPSIIHSGNVFVIPR